MLSILEAAVYAVTTPGTVALRELSAVCCTMHPIAVMENCNAMGSPTATCPPASFQSQAKSER